MGCAGDGPFIKADSSTQASSSIQASSSTQASLALAHRVARRRIRRRDRPSAVQRLLSGEFSG